MEDFNNGFGLAVSQWCPPVFSKLQNKIEYINVFAAFKIISGKKWIHATYSGRIASAFHLDSVLKKKGRQICPSLFSAAGAKEKP